MISEILKMIEGADPSDDNSLNEIDARAWVFLTLNDDFQVSIHKGGRSITYRHNSWKVEDRSVLKHLFDDHQYTRSRDLLKSIRPEGWHWLNTCKYPDGSYHTNMFHNTIDGVVATSGPLPTEELAELHAIIQAIDYERSQKVEAA